MPVYIKKLVANIEASSNGSPLLVEQWFELKQFNNGRWFSVSDPNNISDELQYACHPLAECPFKEMAYTIKPEQWYTEKHISVGAGFYAGSFVTPEGPLTLNLPTLKPTLGPMI
jgi:hypothetical protein